MDNRQRNIVAALDEPQRFARINGMLYYACELGPVYAVNEGVMFDQHTADAGFNYAGTVTVEALPDDADRFELGASGSMSNLDEAIEEWADHCDELATRRGSPSGPRVKVPLRSAAGASKSATA